MFHPQRNINSIENKNTIPALIISHKSIYLIRMRSKKGLTNLRSNPSEILIKYRYED